MSIYIFRFPTILFFGIALLAACSKVNNSIETVAAESHNNVTASKSVAAAKPKAATKGELTAVFAGGCFGVWKPCLNTSKA